MESTLIIIFFILGAVAGSYLNSWMWRWHQGRLRWPAHSICVHCSISIKWFDNLPIVSFLWLSGHCRVCHKPIPPDYLAVELSAACLLAFSAHWYLGHDFTTAGLFKLITASLILLTIFVYDAKHLEIIPAVVWGGSVLIIVTNLYGHLLSPPSMFLGALCAAGFFWAQYAISHGRWIGGGDIRLGVLVGVLLGWPLTLLALGLAYIAGALVAAVLLVLKKKTMNSAIPFATFLSAASWFTLVWGGQVVGWYLKLVRW